MDVAARLWIDTANEQDSSASLRKAMASLKGAPDVLRVWRAMQTDVAADEPSAAATAQGRRKILVGALAIEGETADEEREAWTLEPVRCALQPASGG